MSEYNENQYNNYQNYQNNQQNQQNNIPIEYDYPNQPLMDRNPPIQDNNQQNLNTNNQNYIPPGNQITNQEAPEPTAKPIIPPYASHPFQPIVGPVAPPPYEAQPMVQPTVQPMIQPTVQPYIQPNPQIMVVPNAPIYAPSPDVVRRANRRNCIMIFIIMLIIFCIVSSIIAIY